LNVHAPTEDKLDDVKGSFYEELACVHEKFTKHHMKILLGDFNAILGREDIFKPTSGNESIHELSNDKEVSKVCHTYFTELLNVHNVSDGSQTEVHTAEQLVPGPSRLEEENVTAKLKKYKSPNSDEIPTELSQTGGEILLSGIHKLND
jgi:hypothetical protein